MTAAILSRDAVLTQTLQFELGRCGYTLCAPDQAQLLLLDTRTHASYKIARRDAVCILLCNTPLPSDSAAFAKLPLPLSVRELRGVLASLATLSPHASAADHASLSSAASALSATERAIFECLLAHKGAPVPESELARCLHTPRDAANTLAVYIYRIRRKLPFAHIRRVRGKGYEWTEEPR